MPTASEDPDNDVDADIDDLRLVNEILGANGDLDRSVMIFRRDRLSREARARIPECIHLPCFVACTDWDHRFPGTERDAKVRWVFDRRLWSVVVLHARGADGSWFDAVSREILDVTESLVFANSEALYDVRGWGCDEGSVLPRWSAEATADPRGVTAGT